MFQVTEISSTWMLRIFNNMEISVPAFYNLGRPLFKELLQLIGPVITHQMTNMRSTLVNTIRSQKKAIVFLPFHLNAAVSSATMATC